MQKTVTITNKQIGNILQKLSKQKYFIFLYQKVQVLKINFYVLIQYIFVYQTTAGSVQVPSVQI